MLGAQPLLCSVTPLHQNPFEFIAVSYSGSNEIMYLNGAYSISQTIGAATTGGAGTIGFCNTCLSGSYPFNGYIENVQAYNGVLTGPQVAALYNKGAFGIPSKAQPVSAWWPLNGNAKDLGGNGFNGTATNVAYTQFSYLPQSFSNAYLVSSASVPTSLAVNGNNMLYNVSVVVWH